MKPRRKREIVIDKEIYDWLSKLCERFDPPLTEERFAEALIVAGLMQMGVMEGIVAGMDPWRFIGEESGEVV